MHGLFALITRDGGAALLKICEERRQESLVLEFKTKERPEIGGLTKFDKKNLGAALSGFSNSVG